MHSVFYGLRRYYMRQFFAENPVKYKNRIYHKYIRNDLILMDLFVK
jgi:hypothetical protein